MFKESSDFDRVVMDQFTGMASNPAVSAKQQRFMAMCANNPSKAQGKCPSKKVAREFSHR